MDSETTDSLNSEISNTQESSPINDETIFALHHKKLKTYKNRKLNEPNSSQLKLANTDSSIITSSPQNTSRYGRTRKPKVTEDFYNTEDIFVPYERIPCSPVRNNCKKKTIAQLELSPNKCNEVINFNTVNINSDVTTVLSINIPQDSIEISKVIKIVSNNSSEEFSPKSPSFPKPVKTYVKRDKKNSETIYESFGLPDYPSGENCPYINGISQTEELVQNTKPKENLNLDDNVLKEAAQILPDQTLTSSLEPEKKEVLPQITKNIDVKIKTNTNENNIKRLSNKKNPKKKSPKKLRSSSVELNNLDPKIEENCVKNVVNQVKEGMKIINNKTKNVILDLFKSYTPKVGDLVWARVGTFPFWPAIITNEPNTNEYFGFLNVKQLQRRFHVNFFGDNGRRSWVSHTHMFPFNQKNDLQALEQIVAHSHVKPKDPNHVSAFKINKNQLGKWKTAVDEAENILEYSSNVRIKKFKKMICPKTSKKRKLSLNTSDIDDIPLKKLKIEKVKIEKVKIEEVKIEKVKIEKPKNIETTLKVKKEIVNDSNLVHTPNSLSKTRKSDIQKQIKKTSSIKIEKQNINTIHKNKNSAKINLKSKKKLGKSRNKFKKRTDSSSDESFSESETKEILTTNKSSSARLKKINLFKHITRDRVCQICCKNDNVYKCKGPCYGLYHIECVQKQKLKFYKMQDNIDKTVKIDHDDNSKNIAISVINEIIDNVFKFEENKNDFKQLSILEQFDLKMQEEMKDKIDKTSYADSTTDDSFVSNSEAESCKTSAEGQVLSKVNNKIVSNKIIKHVTADTIHEEEVIVEAPETEVYSSYKCTYCVSNLTPPCLICNENISPLGDVIKHRCTTTQCGRNYHAECLKYWPQAKWYATAKRNNFDHESLSCPSHNCHTCVSDDPRSNSRSVNEKLIKCVRCPSTYHINSFCIPAGTYILSTYQIICPKHLDLDIDSELSTSFNNSKKKKTKKSHLNVSWCFLCSTGGSLICCDLCPSSFHIECLKLTPPDQFICEECESGRLPLYDEIVWVKLGAFRWWPAKILFPVDVPEKLERYPHKRGEFGVEFFGTHDYYWANRTRVFRFHEGDDQYYTLTKRTSSVDELFLKALAEANVAHHRFLSNKANHDASSRISMRPPPYIKIKANKPVGDVRIADFDISNATPCDCNPNWAKPCGPDTYCLNRILLTECNPLVCAAADRCCNQNFQNRVYANVKPFKTVSRGWGLHSESPIKKGTFVIEYVGEIISENEYKRRIQRKHEQKDENYYFLTIDKDRMIDAGPKGNMARFMNHSCQPNCETQKWTVNGDTRVGLFAIQDIPEGTELTFNYNLVCIGEEKKECRCEAPNCSGFIGVKVKQDEKKSSRSLKVKKKRKPPPVVPQKKIFETITCFVCGKPDAIQQCDREGCNKFYHLSCVNLKFLQEGKWVCPCHTCNFCPRRTTRFCYMCVNSYCPLHSKGNIRYNEYQRYVCVEHDKPDELNPINSKPSVEDTKKLLKSKPKQNKNKLKIAKTERKEKQEKKQKNLNDNKKNSKQKILNDNDNKKKLKQIKKLNKVKTAIQTPKINGLHPKVTNKATTSTSNIQKNNNNNNTRLIKKRKLSPNPKQGAHKKHWIKKLKLQVQTQLKIKNGSIQGKKSKSVDDLADMEIETDKKSNMKLRSNSVDKNPSLSTSTVRSKSDSHLDETRDSDDDFKRVVKKFNKSKLNSSKTTNTPVVKRLKGRPKKMLNTEITVKDNSNKTTSDLPDDISLVNLPETSKSNPDIQTELQVNVPVPSNPDIQTELQGNVPEKQIPITIVETYPEYAHLTEINECDSNVEEEIQELQVPDTTNEPVNLENTKKAPKFSKLSLKLKDDVNSEDTIEISATELHESSKLDIPENQDKPIKIKNKIFKLVLRKSPRCNRNSEDQTKLLEDKNQSIEDESQSNEEKLEDSEKLLQLKMEIVESQRELRRSLRIKEDVVVDIEKHHQIQKSTKPKIEEINKIEELVDEDVVKRELRKSTRVQTENNVDVSKRKRGRPFKLKEVNLPTPKLEEENSSNCVVNECASEQETNELFTMQLKTNTIPKMNEVKFTPNIPERHLRVMLRKTEIDTKIGNKFLKMQNDIERNLPIRKRSKLRYETQL